ncbi:copper resistance protein CopC [Sporosarcina sp. P13]|uniref:copper resistance CopC family protein n=1 Tax=Sporosarcina sp. P13 TaxID=2048263 RepID=UPI000C16E0E3|nr:copper resistance CopC family protein [Sporosarcina sp. P13]PIC63027.1 copper resistance protein CopC [Sporosarcina sp. P13]
MKRIISMTFLIIVLLSNTVYAHTNLTTSSPMDGEEVNGEVYEIVLEFNTRIETTSTIKVFDETEEEVSLTTQVDDNVMVGGFMSPLTHGTYTVEWKIIGADGHPMQGTYSFMVRKGELENPAVSEEPKEIPEASIEDLVEKPVVQVIEDSSKIASNDVLVVILVILFTIAGGFLGWIIGRRKNT